MNTSSGTRASYLLMAMSLAEHIVWRDDTGRTARQEWNHNEMCVADDNNRSLKNWMHTATWGRPCE